VITIDDILHPEHIDLDLKAANQGEAIERVASLLKNDPRVKDWQAFYDGLLTKQPCLAAEGGAEICIPHTRTDSVSQMVMSAGRSKGGIVVPGVELPVHFIFVIGVPLALAADYLRIIGAMTRIFRTAAIKSRLRRAKTPDDFLRLLASAEMKL
jgi:mannitol/fructose-specific phosphotransferase system IIA component (Ntr-type)